MAAVAHRLLQPATAQHIENASSDEVIASIGSQKMPAKTDSATTIHSELHFVAHYKEKLSLMNFRMCKYLSEQVLESLHCGLVLKANDPPILLLLALRKRACTFSSRRSSCYIKPMMKAQNPPRGARRRSQTRQESAPSSPMESVLPSPPPLQRSFPLPQSWPAREQAVQHVPQRQSSGFGPAWEQIGGVTRASQHGRKSTFGDAPEHAEAQFNTENFTIGNGKISIRQQPRIPAPDARSNIHRQPPTEPPPNCVLDFDTVAQIDAALYLDPPSRFNINARRHITSGSACLEIGLTPVSQGQAASNPRRPRPARSTPQLRGPNQAPPDLPDPFVHSPSDQHLATTDLVPLTSVVETMDYSRPIQLGDEVHVLDPQ